MEMYINGKLTSGNSNERIEVINPATEEIIGDSPRGTLRVVHDAVLFANTALESWKRTPANERTAALHKIATNIRTHHDVLVDLLTQEEDKPTTILSTIGLAFIKYIY